MYRIEAAICVINSHLLVRGPAIKSVSDRPVKCIVLESDKIAINHGMNSTSDGPPLGRYPACLEHRLARDARISPRPTLVLEAPRFAYFINENL